jgi:DNA-directed RNA polymerase specialized sigma24 family protein
MKRFKNVYNNLSDKDRVVYDLSSSDVSYQEASKILSCSIKQYDNSIQRVRRKIKSAIYCD